MASRRQWWGLLWRLEETIKPDQASFQFAIWPSAGQCPRRVCLVPTLGTEKNPPVQAYWSSGATSMESSVRDVRARMPRSGQLLADRVRSEFEGQVEVEALELIARGGKSIPSNKLNRLLQDCLSQGDLGLGRRIHAIIVKTGFELDSFLANKLIRMYASNNSLLEAIQVFRKLPAPNEFAWRSIISAHVEHGEAKQALELYRELKLSRVKPNDYIFVAVLKACISAGNLRAGKLIHSDVADCRLEKNVFVASTLIDMYAKCGSLEDARRVFDGVPTKTLVLWTAMLGAYVQHDCGGRALDLYERMQREGIVEDKITLLSVLKACGTTGAIQEGERIHSIIVTKGLETDSAIGNALVAMYARFGLLDKARTLFNKISKRNVVTWTALINGYGQQSECGMALTCFEEMLLHGVKPDVKTYTCLLAACSHAGLVREGERYFKMMEAEHRISPTVEHYNCLADLYARSGHLDEADRVLKNMPLKANSVGWRSLLSACKTYANVELGRQCFDQVVSLEPTDAAAYALMTSIYADSQMWDDVEHVKKLKSCAGALKKPAKAVIELNNMVHEFVVGDKCYTPGENVYEKLQTLRSQMKREGHVPQLDLVLRPVCDDEKEDALCGHAEKLAIAFGLLHTPEGTPLRVVKNLRMCNDCHNGSKIISRIEKREITVRDGYRVHHFKDGSCSCGDFH